MKSRFIQNLEKTPKTQDFGKKIQEWVVSGVRTVGKCYRICSSKYKHDPEVFRKSLKDKNNYFKKKQGMRIDKCLTILLLFSKYMAQKRLIKNMEGFRNISKT